MLRRFVAVTALAAALASFLPGSASAQKMGETIDVGGWKIAMQKTSSGVAYCSAIYVYEDKSFVGFMTTEKNDVLFMVSEPTAKMDAGQKYQVKFHVDTAAAVTGMGIASDATSLTVPVPAADVNDTFKSFMKGNSLYITMGKEEFEEPLDGSNDAIVALAKCESGIAKP